MHGPSATEVLEAKYVEIAAEMRFWLGEVRDELEIPLTTGNYTHRRRQLEEVRYTLNVALGAARRGYERAMEREGFDIDALQTDAAVLSLYAGRAELDDSPNSILLQEIFKHSGLIALAQNRETDSIEEITRKYSRTHP